MREAVAGPTAYQVDNAAPAPGQHGRCGHATSVEGATQVDLDILPPDLRVAFPDRTEGPEGAVIVDDEVNRPELGGDAAERILDSRAIDEIHRDGDCRTAGAGD